jgi:hypothetical protein
VESRRDDILTVQTDKKLMQLLPWHGSQEVQLVARQESVLRADFHFQSLFSIIDL